MYSFTQLCTCFLVQRVHTQLCLGPLIRAHTLFSRLGSSWATSASPPGPAPQPASVRSQETFLKLFTIPSNAPSSTSSVIASASACSHPAPATQWPGSAMGPHTSRSRLVYPQHENIPTPRGRRGAPVRPGPGRVLTPQCIAGKHDCWRPIAHPHATFSTNLTNSRDRWRPGCRSIILSPNQVNIMIWTPDRHCRVS